MKKKQVSRLPEPDIMAGGPSGEDPDLMKIDALLPTTKTRRQQEGVRILFERYGAKNTGRLLTIQRDGFLRELKLVLAGKLDLS